MLHTDKSVSDLATKRICLRHVLDKSARQILDVCKNRTLVVITASIKLINTKMNGY